MAIGIVILIQRSLYSFGNGGFTLIIANSSNHVQVGIGADGQN